ncbi:hypothetical protein Sviol_49870 [Streptomyces violascens]|uniref:Secreted protein n=1 Tax=Streptomyces violascens TaxID=67381 RepID=A0ABQ3QTP1_9ACTN|nr:hypothetical protein Sviol_49870 [Streptomyces violascens]
MHEGLPTTALALFSGLVGGLALCAAAFLVLARHFAAQNRRGWAIGSRIATGASSSASPVVGADAAWPKAAESEPCLTPDRGDRGLSRDQPWEVTMLVRSPAGAEHAHSSEAVLLMVGGLDCSGEEGVIWETGRRSTGSTGGAPR